MKLGWLQTGFTGLLAVALVAGSAVAEPSKNDSGARLAKRPPIMRILETPNERAVERLSLARSLPIELSAEKPEGEPEAFRVILGDAAQALPAQVDLVSEDLSGRLLDVLRDVPLTSAPCPKGLQSEEPRTWACASTEPLRLVSDLLDRNHAAAAHRSVMGEVGGRLLVQRNDKHLGSIRIGAPEELGSTGRYRVRLRARIVRTYAGGPPAVGKNTREAREIVQRQVAGASALFGQCGIHFGAPDSIDVQVVDPPRLSMLVVGCQAGLPASGGEVSLLVDGEKVVVRTVAGQSPLAVASKLAESIRERGFDVEVHRNAQVESAALPTVDLLVHGESREPVSLKPARGNSFTDDPSLSVCSGLVDFGDGLTHFTDTNASAGTLEERSLLRTLVDDDPSTIDLLVVPSFGGAGRIGESFIYAPGVSIQNAVILDRAGIRAGARSFTLAHELGHVLLDMPGHPDDFGVDEPTSLMDADASDATIFGPRRLSLKDCVRALRQSGPAAPVPLLEPWPLTTDGGAKR